MSSQNNAFSDRIIGDLIRAIKLDSSITSFEIIPTASNANKNSSPVLRGEETLGLESWVLKHVLPHANRQILDVMTKKDPDRLIPCLWAVNLLNPDMPTAWARRKELILRRRLCYLDELRLTRMVLSWKPKCNEALAHRRWLISKNLIPSDKLSILREELDLANVIADRYHSNYHAWTHRVWVMQNLAPISPTGENQQCNLLSEFSKRDMCILFSTSPLSLYLVELETNVEFITSHVSDHSGLHYRTFLLRQVFLLFRNYQNNNSCFKEDPTLPIVDGDRGREALLLYNSIKQRLKKFLVNCHNFPDNILSDYLRNLELQLTIFDVVASFLIDEISSNSSLSNLYLDHEALWTFRRFIIHNVILICNDSKIISDSGVGDILLCWIRDNEETLIRNSSNSRSVNCYSKWFSKICFRPNIHLGN